MLDVAALSFPSSSVVAGWWRQLAPLHAEALWIGHLHWRRVETLVQAETPRSLTPLESIVLQGLTQPGAAAAAKPVEHLSRKLHFPEAILRQTLLGMSRYGLTDAVSGVVSELGRKALALGTFSHRHWQRRSFAFLDRADRGGQPCGAPVFVAIDGVAATSWPAPPWDDALLRDCLQQPEVWKQAAGFPLDVNSLADAAPPEIPAWQRVTLIRPERTLAALVLCRNDGAEQFVAVAARDSTPLATTAPFLQDRGQLRQQAPELTPVPDETDVRSAWLQWCKKGGVSSPLADVGSGKLDGVTLRVQAPPILLNELRRLRCAIDGQEWLLLGTGPIRRAAQLKVVAIG